MTTYVIKGFAMLLFCTSIIQSYAVYGRYYNRNNDYSKACSTSLDSFEVSLVPELFLLGKESGSYIKKAQLLVVKGPAYRYNFSGCIDIIYALSSCKITALRNLSEVVFEHTEHTLAFSSQLRDGFKKLEKGDLLIFTDIKIYPSSLPNDIICLPAKIFEID